MSILFDQKSKKSVSATLREQIKKLPDTPGVYFFLGPKKKILYIGKATSLRDRVKSYLSKDLEFTRGQLIVGMINKAVGVTFVPTDSVLEALILEANLIKKHQPPHNTDEKDDKSYNYIVVTKEAYPRVLLVRGKDIPVLFPEQKRKYIIGPFPYGTAIKEGIKIIRRIFPYRTNCTPAEEMIKDGKLPKACFDQQIGLCPGVCTGAIDRKGYAKIIKHLILFFEGKKSKIVKDLEVEMKRYAKRRAFEQASEIKGTLFALTHIQDVSLIKESSESLARVGYRIESYDIAHIGGKDMVGVMTVSEDGRVKKSDYRKFRIRGFKDAHDAGALKEMLTRRLRHREWPLPHLIVVDGNQIQRNAATEVLRSYELTIPVVSVVKDARHKPDHLEGDSDLTQTHKKTILLLNSEAHRFAITYHKNLRSRNFLNT